MKEILHIYATGEAETIGRFFDTIETTYETETTGLLLEYRPAQPNHLKIHITILNTEEEGNADTDT